MRQGSCLINYYMPSFYNMFSTWYNLLNEQMLLYLVLNMSFVYFPVEGCLLWLISHYLSHVFCSPSLLSLSLLPSYFLSSSLLKHMRSYGLPAFAFNYFFTPAVRFLHLLLFFNFFAMDVANFLIYV